VFHHSIHTVSLFHLREDERPVSAHLAAIAFHHSEVRSDRGSQVDLVDQEQVGLGDTRTALTRYLVAAGDVNDVDCVVGQLPAEVGCKVVSAGLDEEDLRLKPRRKLLEGNQIH